MLPVNYNLFKKILLLCSLISFNLFAQNKLSGKIVNQKDNEPVSFANVFLVNTTIGVAAREDGTYELKNIPNGKYEIVVSVIGFKRFHKQIEFQSGDVKLDISLVEEAVVLSELTVKPKQQNKKHLVKFRELFIGQTQNARQCFLINPEALDFNYDPQTQILTVTASEPIIVENRSLGYRINYTLDFFEFNYRANFKRMRGLQLFEELPAVSKKDSLKISKKRRVAYQGSLNHFMKAVFDNRIKEEGFSVYRADSSELYSKAPKTYVPFEMIKFITGAKVKKFTYKGMIKIDYGNEDEEYEYRRAYLYHGQTSYLTFLDSSISIFENGYFVQQLAVALEGYLGWSEVIAEALPLNFK